MKGIKLIVVFLLFSFAALAQIDSMLVKKSSVKQLKKLGKNAMKQNDLGAAVVFFEAYLKKSPKDASVMYLLAKSYYEIGDYELAQGYFDRAYTTDKEKSGEALYYEAQMMKSLGKYDSAKLFFQKFKKEYKGDEKSLKKQAGKEIAFCDSVQKLIGTEKKIVITHLDSTINKVNTEGAPVHADENTMVFTSLRTDKIEYVIEDDTASPVIKKLYYAKKENGIWKYAGEYGENFNVPGYSTGNACFSTDRQRIYFTRCKENQSGKMICAIFVSEKKGDSWSEPVKLPKNINNPKFTSTMPAVTRDPVKGNDIVYFVSDNKEGRGGMDIWYTVYDSKTKTYKTPKNAGNKLNTTEDEISPFFDNDTRTLYFSSNGLGGLGGFDIYKAIGDGKKWSSSENIGKPINSGADEVFYTIAPNREEGFFVSNRKGGTTIKGKGCCDDIYNYKLSEYIKITLAGVVTEKDNPGQAVPGATVEVYIKDKKTDEKFMIKNFIADEKGKYATTLEADRDYTIIFKKTEYLGTSGEVTTNGIRTTTDLIKDGLLERRPKDPIHIPNIQYEFDKSNIMEVSKIAIDTTVLRLMEANPEVIVEIQSHTDSKGSDQYNEKLSQKRAESVVTYLIGKGINPLRLKAKGYGESKPIALNENADGSDNPVGRAQNRRTDFKIIGTLDIEVLNAGTDAEE
ncbi:MAG: OmpA family protein [Bacteroidetes bacterium]|nr:OmpA family protein [Bacteroidota bacterium]